MGVNVKAIFFSVKHGLPYLRRKPAELRGQRRLDQQLRRPGGDAGLHGVEVGRARPGRSIALDYAAIGLRCNCVCPGITDTPMLRQHLDKTPDPERPWPSGSAACRCGCPVTPGDIARPVLYLSCEDSAGVDGDLAGRRRRLPRRRRVGRRIERCPEGPGMTLETGLRRLHVPAAAPRQVARPDRHARLRGGGHRPVRRPVAPLALAGVRRPGAVGARAGRQARATGGSSSPTSSSRPAPDFVSLAPNHPDAAVRRRARDCS